MITSVFILVLILPLRFSNDDVGDNEHNNHIYAPTDTAIISFHHPFCDRLTLNSPDTELLVEVTLHLLEETPPLEEEERAVFYREPILTRGYEYWRMFLYPGSSVGYSACSVMEGESPVTFYLVKGNGNFDRWQIGHSNTHIEELEITTACEGADENTTFSFEVQHQDNYYFIFNSESSTESITGIVFDFERTLYAITNSSILSQCSVILNASSSCSLSIPYSTKPVALLQLESLVPDPMEWDADIKVSVRCSPRTWLYVVISFSALAFVGLLIVGAILVYFWFCDKKRVGRPSTTAQREDSHLISEKKPDPYDPPPPYQPQWHFSPGVYTAIAKRHYFFA